MNAGSANVEGATTRRDASVPRRLTHLQRLEAESIHIMREAVAESENPVMLYSIGKDSSVMLHLARKAFYPAAPPFPLLHVDTTWKFQAMYEFRDKMVAESGMELLVHRNPDVSGAGHQPVHPRLRGAHRHVEDGRSEAGARHSRVRYCLRRRPPGRGEVDEPRSGSSPLRSAQHRWDPKLQRPELWRLYNARRNQGESIRVFPLSNWTELDVWQYIHLEQIPIVPLYLAARRPVVERDGTLIMVDDDRMPLAPGRATGGEERPLPDAGLLPADRGDRERSRHAARRSFRRCCSPPRPSAKDG